jgi:hypothetical protein
MMINLFYLGTFRNVSYKLPIPLAQETEVLLGSAFTATRIMTFRRNKMMLSLSLFGQLMQQGFSYAVDAISSQRGRRSAATVHVDKKSTSM